MPKISDCIFACDNCGELVNIEIVKECKICGKEECPSCRDICKNLLGWDCE